MEKDKLAYVVSGGAMSCAFGAGVLAGVREKYNEQPDIRLGMSAGSPIVSLHGAGQADDCTRLWKNHLTAPDIFNEAEIKLITANIDKFKESIKRLLDDDFRLNLGAFAPTINTKRVMKCIREEVPIDVNSLHANDRTETVIPATNTFTGKTKYFSNRDVLFQKRGNENLWFEVVRASCSLPLVCESSIVEIEGERYIDGAISVPLIEGIRQVAKRGAKRVLVVKNDYPFPDEPITEFLVMLHMGRTPHLNRILRNFAKKQFGSVRLGMPQLQVETIMPFRRLPTGYTNNNPENVHSVFDSGYRKALESSSLERFFDYNPRQWSFPLELPQTATS